MYVVCGIVQELFKNYVCGKFLVNNSNSDYGGKSKEPPRELQQGAKH